MLSVALVEDSPAIRRRLQSLLEGIDGVSVVGHAEDVGGAVALLDASRPDVVVLDVALRDGDRGMTVLQFLRRAHPSTEVIAMSNFSWHAMKQGFIDAGAAAYFDKATEFQAARDWIEARSRRGRDSVNASSPAVCCADSIDAAGATPPKRSQPGEGPCRARQRSQDEP